MVLGQKVPATEFGAKMEWLIKFGRIAVQKQMLQTETGHIKEQIFLQNVVTLW